jgi:hypothetical protein
MGLRQYDEGLSHNQNSQIPKKVEQRSRKTSCLLFVSIATLVVLECGGLLLFVGIFAPVILISLPTPCIDGGPGSSAIFSNGGTHLFTFPESATNIRSSCYTWQSASIDVWFEMDADELEPLLDSMRWDVRPLVSTDTPPDFGNPRRNATYLYGEYSQYPEGASIWIDTSNTPYRVFVYAWLD